MPLRRTRISLVSPVLISPLPDAAGGSSVVMGAAPGLEILVLGRALYGLGIGFAMHAAPAYIAEAAPARVRGTLIR